MGKCKDVHIRDSSMNMHSFCIVHTSDTYTRTYIDRVERGRGIQWAM